MSGPQAQQQINPAQQNALARGLIVNQSIERLQSIFTNTVVPANQGQIVVNPRNVGLIKGFFVDVQLTISNPVAGPTLTLSSFGPANALSQVKFDDLQNNTRIQTAGWHIHSINTVRNNRPFGLCETLDTSPISYGNNHDVITAPATIPADTIATVNMRYYIPMAYSNEDLRGAIYANVVNATMQLQLTLNPTPFSNQGDANPVRDFLSIYTTDVAASTATITAATVTVYQHYLDQLPIGPQGPILPVLDLQTIYELKNTTVTGVSSNQDYTIPYSNFRTFLSTFAVTPEIVTNYWALRSANFTDIFKVSLTESALLTRLQIGLDFPDFVNYFNHRSKPINTIQYGNMELVLNGQLNGASNSVLMGYEDFAMINVVSGAGSLPAGG